MADLKLYRAILTDLEKENLKIDEDIKKVTAKLKAQKATNNSHAKKITAMIAEIEGTVIAKAASKK